jgi:Right handed beta helix region
VVDSGSGGGRCDDARRPAEVSARAPWCTLERAARAGHGTVLVRGGPYPRLTFADRQRRIAFRAYPGERPTIEGVTVEKSSGFSFTGFRFTREVDLTSVSHLSFADNLSPLWPAGDQTLSGYLVTGVSDASWTRNEVTNGWMGIHFRWNGVKRVRIAGNSFVRLGGQGIHLERGRRVWIERNRFADIRPRLDIDPAAHADAVQTLGPSRHVIFDSNLVTGGRGFMIQFSRGDYGIPDGQTGMVVENNLFTGIDFGIRVFSAPGIRIVNNTDWGTQTGSGSGIDFETRLGANLPTTGALLRNNIVKRLDVFPGNGYREDHNLIVTGPRKGRHDLSRPPVFVDPMADWRLAPRSPGSGAGTRAGAPSRDRTGRLRPSNPDLGSDQS